MEVCFLGLLWWLFWYSMLEKVEVFVGYIIKICFCKISRWYLLEIFIFWLIWEKEECVVVLIFFNLVWLCCCFGEDVKLLGISLWVFFEVVGYLFFFERWGSSVIWIWWMEIRGRIWCRFFVKRGWDFRVIFGKVYILFLVIFVNFYICFKLSLVFI